jgi:hypothetical protein
VIFGHTARYDIRYTFPVEFKEWCDEIESLGGEIQKMNSEWLGQSYRKGMTPHQVVFGPGAPSPSPAPTPAPQATSAPSVDPRHWKILKVVICAKIIRVAAYLLFTMSASLMVVAIRAVIALQQLTKSTPPQSPSGDLTVPPIRDYDTIASVMYLLATSVVCIFCASFGAIFLLVSYFVQRNKHLFEPT